MPFKRVAARRMETSCAARLLLYSELVSNSSPAQNVAGRRKFPALSSRAQEGDTHRRLVPHNAILTGEFCIASSRYCDLLWIHAGAIHCLAPVAAVQDASCPRR